MAATAADSAEGGNAQRGPAMTPELRARLAVRGWPVREVISPWLLEDLWHRIACAIREAEAAERETCTKIITERAANCDEHGTEHFCEQFGCHSLDDLAAGIRARGEAAGRSTAEPAS